MFVTLKFYHDYLKATEELRTKHGGNFLIEPNWTIDQEITRLTTHIHRLETNHIDCVIPCSLGCKANV